MKNSNRVIKFRAWDKLNNEMTNFDLFERPTATWGKNCEIMQFTGLKDKNGKEIYEGDVVKVGEVSLYTINWYQQSSAFWIFTISPVSSKNHIASAGMPMREWNWLDGGKAIYFHGMKGKSLEVEIIGNVWETPELLSEKAK